MPPSPHDIPFQRHYVRVSSDKFESNESSYLLHLTIEVRPSAGGDWLLVPMLFDTGSQLTHLPHPNSQGGPQIPKDWEKQSEFVEVTNTTNTYRSPIMGVHWRFPKTHDEYYARFAFLPDPHKLATKEQSRRSFRALRRFFRKDVRSQPYGVMSLFDLERRFHLHTIENEYGEKCLRLEKK